MESDVKNDGPASRINPKRRRQFNRGGQEVDYFVSVVCTDRGQHKRVLLTTARRELDGIRGMSHALQYFAPPMGDQATPGSFTGRSSYTFRCPHCTRTPQIQGERWWWLLDEIIRADGDEIDISLLP